MLRDLLIPCKDVASDVCRPSLHALVEVFIKTSGKVQPVFPLLQYFIIRGQKQNLSHV